MPKTRLLSLPVIACFLLPFRLFADPLADAPAFSLAPAELQRLAAEATAGLTSSAVVLLHDEYWTFRPDSSPSGSSIERRQHFIFKVLNESGVAPLSTLQESWEPWRQERPSFRARVITTDGVAHEFDPKTLSDAPAGSVLPQTYSDARILQGPLPAVATGAIIETELVDRLTPVLGSLAFRSYLAAAIPVKFSRFTADYPQTLPFTYSAALCPDLKVAKDVRGGNVHLVLSLGAFEPVTENPPLLPFDVPRLANIYLSTGPSWNDLAIQYGKILDRQIANAPVKEFVAKALNGERDRTAAIQKLVRALHSEVRYTGIEFADAAIVPAKPADILARKYGDCKDKASLLIAMLREAGIPSYLALLNAGLAEDIAPQHPGIDLFNHAIVYIPGAPALWIDATAAHFEVGSLPALDEGRLALIVEPKSTELVRIPESGSSANISNTAIDYRLPGFGPSHVILTAGGTGQIDSGFRDLASVLDDEKIRAGAEKQAQAQWQTAAKVKFSYPAATDFSKPMEVVTDVPESKSLVVSESGASLTVPMAAVFSGLPQFFLDDSKEATDETTKKKPRTQGFVLPAAFQEKWVLRIHIPAGFVLNKLPEDRTQQFGPARYTARFTSNGQLLTAEIVLDTVKRSYTLDEGNALKKSTLDFLKQPSPEVKFQPLGQTLLEQGRLRAALDAFRQLTAGENREAVNHIRLSRAYLATGCGREARSEAKIAQELAPKLGVSWRNFAYVYERDLVGREYKPGWNPAIVESALRKAMSLDPDDFSANVELAGSFSHDAAGNSYESAPRLIKAVEVFEQMGDAKLEEQGAQDTMLYDLAMLGKLDQLKSKLDRFGSNDTRAHYPIFLTAAREGGARAAADLRASSADANPKEIFSSAVGLLARTGRYKEEADLATAMGFESQMFMPVEMLRRVKRVDTSTLHPDTPENLVRCYVAANGAAEENLDGQLKLWSALAPVTPLRQYLQESRKAMLRMTAQRNLLIQVNRDIFFANAGLATEANGTEGFRVKLTIAGRTTSMMVLREHNELKLLAFAQLPQGLARQALNDVQAGSDATARKWLDWLREEIKIRSEDDPLAGPVFPRIWNKGATASPAQIRYAAAALLASEEALPILREAIDSGTDASVKALYRLAYLETCAFLHDWAKGVPDAKALVAAYPGSETAVRLLSLAYAGSGQVDQAREVLQQAAAAGVDGLANQRLLDSSLRLAGHLDEADEVSRKMVADPNATPGDWNNYGWLSLFLGTTNEEKLHQVERAQSEPDPAIANTVAAMEAELGKLNEARQITLQIMEKFGYENPDSPSYYVFGRIAEKLGAKASAAAYYQQAQAGADSDDALSVASLAHKRLEAMKTDGS